MLRIRELTHNDLEKVRQFTDLEIGAGYYSTADLELVFSRSRKSGKMFSLVLEDDASIQGIRITYPPGQWERGKGPGLNVDKWPHALSETGYFQSIFVSSALVGHGWGGKLSEVSLKALKEFGALGVVCHSWKESPHGSSTRYLKKLGFQVVAEHPGYWKDVDYNCTKCLKPPCTCTAQEMYLDFNRK